MFVVVVVFTLVQGTTLPPVARWLRVTAANQASELRVETAPLDRMQADLLEFEIPVGSRLNGVHLDELRLPVGAVVTHGAARRRGIRPGERHPAARPATRC